METISLSINVEKQVHYALKKLALEKGITMTKLILPGLIALLEREKAGIADAKA